MNCLEDGQISAKYSSGEVGIRPVVFSHGWTGDSSQYSGIARDLASHGYLVVAINHRDGSCFYTEREDGTPFLYERGPYLQKELRIR